MAKTVDRNMLTIGAICVIVVVSILLYTPASVLTQWWMVPAMMLALSGIWLMVLAAMQRSNPVKYGPEAFGYFSWGLLLIALGGALFLYNIVYSLVLILLVFAVLAIVAALRRK